MFCNIMLVSNFGVRFTTQHHGVLVCSSVQFITLLLKSKEGIGLNIRFCGQHKCVIHDLLLIIFLLRLFVCC
jgi:hypothetical protein